MLYDIKRYNSPNFESRVQYKPIMMVCHITDGTEAVRRNDEHEETAVYNTFMNPATQVSSTLTITRDGRIKQFVDIMNAAWTQGLSPGMEANSKSPIVRNMGWRTNLYSLSIEFDAWGPNGGDGNITEEQFWAGAWALRWLQQQVFEKYGHKIQLNSTYVTGHCVVDPKRKPLCPGVNFPWQRLYQELAIADGMNFEDYERRISFIRSYHYKVSQAFAIANEVFYLHELVNGSDGVSEWAKQMLNNIHPIMTTHKLMKKPYNEASSYDDVKNEVEYQYNLALTNTGDGAWAREQLIKLYPYMLQNGLVPSV